MQNELAVKTCPTPSVGQAFLPMASVRCALAIGLAFAASMTLIISLTLVPVQCAEASPKKPATVTSMRAAATPSKTVVKWKRVKKISGYQIRFSTKKSMRNATKKRVTKKSKRRTSLRTKPGKTYWIQIRTYKKSHGKRIYSKWSKKLKIRTPKRSVSKPTNACAHSWQTQPITRYVVTSPAWDETINGESMYYCNGCNAPFANTSDWIDHSDRMIDDGDMTHDSYRGPVATYATIHHPEEGHIEILGHKTFCAKCGEIVK